MTGRRVPWPRIRRTGAVGLVFAVCLAALAAAPGVATRAAAKSEKGGGERGKGPVGFYATTVGRSALDVIIVQYWSKGPLFRSETVVAGHPIVTLVRGNDYYTWDALTKEGYVVRRTPSAVAADARRERPFGIELREILDEGGEKIRSETLNGIRVDVYQQTDDSGRRTLWVDSERLDLPIRLETYSRRSGRTGQLDWINWIPGLVIPDAFFAAPKDIELTRFDSYESYLERLARGPVPPAPPLFHYLLHAFGDGGAKPEKKQDKKK